MILSSRMTLIGARFARQKRHAVSLLGFCPFVVACGARTGLESDGDVARVSDNADHVAPETDGAVSASSGCGTTGSCTSTRSIHSGALGGLAGADAICNAEIPDSHFFRQTCDSRRGFLGSTNAGFVELEQGACWNCNGWTAGDSGPYSPSTIPCSTGYATVGAL